MTCERIVCTCIAQARVKRALTLSCHESLDFIIAVFNIFTMPVSAMENIVFGFFFSVNH